LFEKVSY